MNILGLRCTVKDGRGLVTAVIINDGKEVHRVQFQSPSVFSFSNDAGELLNWHRENILSLISRFQIEAIGVKKSETNSFGNYIRKSDIFKLYLEGVLLSLAGSVGMPNYHFFKNDFNYHLAKDYCESSLEDIAEDFGLQLVIGGLTKPQISATREALLTVVAILIIENDD